jgi:alpha-galactosidase|eukprot:COSAG06_NODE_345_length_17054_cov_3.313476_16_plen_156_part_00
MARQGLRCRWLLLFLAESAAALDNGRLRTPALGFSDACLGGAENTRLGAKELQAVATGFIETGLTQLGYTSMNLDDSWELMNRSASGELLPDPAKFPAGIKPLRDWLHARNLSLGLYTSDAERSCKPTAGSLYHESLDAKTLALDFQVDFIKVDK